MDNKNDFNYKLNPCKACKLKYTEPSDVNNINNCCMETLGAFMGSSSINDIRNTPEAQNCVKCMDDAICEMGSNTCDMRLTLAPTFVDNSNPHYFPSLLEQHKDVNKAKMLCYDFCLDCKNCENTCVQNCTIDAAAVETYKKIDNTDNPKSDKRDKSDKSKHKKNYKRTNPISFYTAFVIFLILFIFLIYNFLTYMLQ